ncbi:hypothetical protein GJAV_G00225240 [Gymnothorax javanicus]|nr:hypothetical protein GJAV_G00225240 [Gymnothorax javanicus]
MADILTLVLSHNRLRSQDLKNSSSISETNWSSPTCMIVGDHCGVKTSLLFLAAITAASELGIKVFFLSPTPIQKLPGSLQDSLAHLNPDDLKKINFKYPKSRQEMLQDVATLHEFASGPAAPPSLIIVDRLEHYVGVGSGAGLEREDQQAAAHIAALLADTAAFLSRKLEERGGASAPCRVIVSFDSNRQGHASSEAQALDPVLHILDRYFPVRATLDRDWNSACPGTSEEPGAAWQIYFSGTGVTGSQAAGKGEDRGFGQQWGLVIRQNGAMEFSLMGGEDQAKQ